MTSIRSVWAARPPDIDGVAEAHEWDDGGRLELPNTLVFFKNDAENLYILLDVIGDTVASWINPEHFWIAVDVDRSKNITPNTDILFVGVPHPEWAFVKQYYLTPGEWTGSFTPVSEAATGFGTSFNDIRRNHRRWELALDLEEIGADPASWWGSDDRPPVVRMGMEIASRASDFVDHMPLGFEKNFADLLEISLATQPEFPAADIGPVFLGVGLIPYGRIDPGNGHATTEEDAPLPVENAAFGRRLDVLGNIRKLWHEYEVSQYRIWYRQDGGDEQVLLQTWSNYKREEVAGVWEDVLYSIGPDDQGIYDLPNPDDDWLTANLLLRWQTHGFGGGNGLYTVRIELLNRDGKRVDVGEEEQLLRLYIDNTLPTVDIPLMQHGEDEVGRCAIVHQEDTGFRFQITVNDPEGHLRWYRLRAHHGDPDDDPVTIAEETYAYNPDPAVPHGFSWDGVSEHWVPEGPEDWRATESCAYGFHLGAAARIINGYGWVYPHVWCSKYVTIEVP